MRWDRQVELGPLPETGVLVVVEGTDGSGKSTLVDGIVAELQRGDVPSFATLQPTPSLRATEIFQLGLHNDATLDEYRALYLCTIGDRLYHRNTALVPHLAAGEVVVCDRYVFTTFANLMSRGHDFETWMREVCAYLPQPHLSLWADAPPDLAIERVRARPHERRRLNEPYIRGLYDAYAALAAAGELTRIDTSGEAADAIAAAFRLIQPLLAERRIPT
jgi:thymidylate kinase